MTLYPRRGFTLFPHPYNRHCHILTRIIYLYSGSRNLSLNWFRHFHQLLYGRFRTCFKCYIFIVKKRNALRFDLNIKVESIGYSEEDHSRFLEHGWRNIYSGQMLNLIVRTVVFNCNLFIYICSYIIVLGYSKLAG